VIEPARALIADAKSLAIVCHIHPDGDALGSSLALAASARLAGIRSVASFSEPFVLSPIYDYLPLDLLVPPAEFPVDSPLVVSIDAASVDRLGTLAGVVDAAGTLVVIDHHISNKGFGTVDLIDPTAAASAEIVYRLIRALEWPVDQTVANALLTGIVTDTGRFQYSNTTPDTLRIAAELLEAGASPEVIGQNMYERVPFGFLKVEADVLGRSQLDGTLVWSVLYLDDVRRWGVGVEDTDSLIDTVRLAWEARVAALIKELDDRSYKVSLRSRGETDVAAIASAHGGGGHHNAAGFSHPGPPEAIVEAIKERL
jgi:bifunctional oligoribonuclease and PAP phosphatase NrnA